MKINKNNDYFDGEDETSWVFSYADIMSFLVAFFVILLSVSDINKDKLDELGKAIAQDEEPEEEEESNQKQQKSIEMQTIQTLISLKKEEKEGTGSDKGNEDRDGTSEEKTLVLEGKKGIDKDQASTSGNSQIQHLVNSSSVPQYFEIQLPNSFLFNSGQSRLSAKAVVELTRLANTLKKQKSEYTIEIVGHSDSLPCCPVSGMYNNNFALSSARAGAVADIMQKNGIQKGYLTVRGMADLAPLLPEKNDEGKMIERNMEKNRRVEIIIKKKVKT